MFSIPIEIEEKNKIHIKTQRKVGALPLCKIDKETSVS
jgi:hypothetical protein